MSSGLRERKKAQTRQDISYAALRLFAERGYDAVTVPEIAEQANVSPATFFRYFATKGSAVVGIAPDLIGRLQETLANRPANATTLEVAHEFWLGVGELVEADPDVFHAQQELTDRYPALAAERVRVVESLRRTVAASLGEESPRRPAAQVELISFAVVGAVLTAQRLWHEQGGDVREIFTDCWRYVERIAVP